jgi:hypothetical protein
MRKWKLSKIKYFAPSGVKQAWRYGIKLTYVCKLFSKNLLHDVSYLVSYLTRHKKFTTFSMFKYT